MRIGIDARSMFAPRPRGTGRNLRDLYALLSRARPDWSFVLYDRRRAACDGCADESAGAAGAVRAAGAESPDFLERSANVARRTVELPGDRFDAWSRWGLPLAAWRDGIDLLHYPANDAPGWCPVPFVTTVHDLIPLRVADEANESERRRFVRRLRRATRRAAHLIVPSRATGNDLAELFGVAPQRVRVIPWAPDRLVLRFAELRRAAPARANDAVNDVARRYGLRSPWLVNFSGAAPRKNGLRLIEGFARFVGRFGGGRSAPLDAIERSEPRAPCDGWSPQLVLAGCEPRDYQERLLRAARDAGAADDCRFLGFVPHADVAPLIGGACGLLIPSRYEGFGLPVLDAFALGVPVVASRAASLPEVAGDAAVYCDPSDVESIADAIARVLDGRVAARLVEAGAQRVRGFTWVRTADLVADVFVSCCEAARAPVSGRRRGALRWSPPPGPPFAGERAEGRGA